MGMRADSHDKRDTNNNERRATRFDRSATRCSCRFLFSMCCAQRGYTLYGPRFKYCHAFSFIRMTIALCGIVGIHLLRINVERRYMWQVASQLANTNNENYTLLQFSLNAILKTSNFKINISIQIKCH